MVREMPMLPIIKELYLCRRSDREERSTNTVFEQRLPGTSVDAMTASPD